MFCVCSLSLSFSLLVRLTHSLQAAYEVDLKDFHSREDAREEDLRARGAEVFERLASLDAKERKLAGLESELLQRLKAISETNSSEEKRLKVLQVGVECFL
jgi:hypothetical protein